MKHASPSHVDRRNPSVSPILALLAFFALGCQPARVGIDPEHAGSRAASLESRGSERSLAVSAGPMGLRLHDTHGATLDAFPPDVLGADPILGCVVDPVVGVVWLSVGSEGKDLAAVDLRAPTPAAVTVVRGAFAAERLIIAHGPGSVGIADANYAAALVFELTPPPRLSLEEGNFSFVEERLAEARRALETAELVESELLAELGRRAASLQVPSAQPVHVELPGVDPSEACEAPELCGEGYALPGMPLAVVVQRHSCGDGCYVDYGLFDTQAQRFVRVEAPSELAGEEGFEPLAYSPAARAWVTRTRLVGADDGTRATLDAGVFCGWLDADARWYGGDGYLQP